MIATIKERMVISFQTPRHLAAKTMTAASPAYNGVSKSRASGAWARGWAWIPGSRLRVKEIIALSAPVASKGDALYDIVRSWARASLTLISQRRRACGRPYCACYCGVIISEDNAKGVCCGQDFCLALVCGSCIGRIYDLNVSWRLHLVYINACACVRVYILLITLFREKSWFDCSMIVYDFVKLKSEISVYWYSKD